jgi:multisubunit Na+/H+ antiporter MnhG subunit
MNWKKNIFFAITNGLLFLVIPDYIFWALVLLGAGFIFCLAVFIIDLFKGSHRWENATKYLGWGVLSYIIGFVCIIIRNYSLGYYSGTRCLF